MSNETPTQLQGLILTRIWDIGSKQEAATAISATIAAIIIETLVSDN